MNEAGNSGNSISRRSIVRKAEAATERGLRIQAGKDGSATGGNLDFYTNQVARYRITTGGGHQWTTDGSFGTAFSYTFRDAVGMPMTASQLIKCAQYLNLYNLQMMGGIDVQTLYNIKRLKNCDKKKLNSQLYEN